MVITARKRSLGQGNIFTPVCHSVHGGGRAWLLRRGDMHGCSGGVCMVAPGGHMCGCSRGACMAAPGGRAWLLGGPCMVLFGGCAWFYSGGCAWFFQFFRIQWDTVNERVVRILLECILVLNSFKLCKNIYPSQMRISMFSTPANEVAGR